MLVIGGGPAGLRAAEVASAGGARVILADQKRSVGRKFLVAGKGGLNLTHGEPREKFVAKYRGPEMPSDFWPRALERFDNQAIQKWATDLGIETFQASSGRIYPKSLKGAPMLRRWVERLRAQGVEFRMNHQLTNIGSGFAEFDSNERIEADATILAMGGGSWTHTGSDGRWVNVLRKAGVAVADLASANCGWEIDWPPEIVPEIEGQPIKNVIVRAGEDEAMGELMLTKYGIEGGPIYKLGPALRAMSNPSITLDFKPTFSADKLARKMESVRRDFLEQSAQRWKLSAPAQLLLNTYATFDSAESLAVAAKMLTIPVRSARPIDEAISSAGGIRWTELDEHLMLKSLPTVYAAGEMIDWEAPTGGYLLQGCFATGTIAAEAALGHLLSR